MTGFTARKQSLHESQLDMRKAWNNAKETEDKDRDREKERDADGARRFSDRTIFALAEASPVSDRSSVSSNSGGVEGFSVVPPSGPPLTKTKSLDTVYPLKLHSTPTPTLSCPFPPHRSILSASSSAPLLVPLPFPPFAAPTSSPSKNSEIISQPVPSVPSFLLSSLTVPDTFPVCVPRHASSSANTIGQKRDEDP